MTEKIFAHAGVDAGYRIDPRLGFHDRRVEPGLEGRGLAPSTTSPFRFIVSNSLFADHGQADSRGDQEAVAAGNARADMAEPFDQFLVRKNPAGADDVFSKLLDGGPWGSFKF